MLREDPDERPNVYIVLREACHLQGIEVPIDNVRYTHFPFSRQLLTHVDIRWENRVTNKTKPVITQPAHTCVSCRRRCLLTTEPAKACRSGSGTNAPRAANYDSSGLKAISVSYARDRRRPICCSGCKVRSPNRRALLKVPELRPILSST